MVHHSTLGFPALGSAGAAIATVISRFVEAAIVMIAVHRKKAKYSFIVGAYKSLKVPGSLVKGILQKGIPLLLNETLWAGGMAVLNQCYSVRGFDVVSAVNISVECPAKNGASFNIEYSKEGQVFGIGCKIFTIAGPVILYGILTSWALGLIYWILKLLGVA